MFIADTEEGKAVADALVILGISLHRISIEGTGRFKFVPSDPQDPYLEKRSPTDFIRRSQRHLLERYRMLLNIQMGTMYEKPTNERIRNKAKGAGNDI